MLRGRSSVAFVSSVLSGAASSRCLLGRLSPLLSLRGWIATTACSPAHLHASWTDSSRYSMPQRGSSATGGSTPTSNRSSAMFSTGCQLTLLALFDVSAAFDTVDYEILLKRLNVSFGFSGTLLLWLRSFLTERSLCVVHGSSRFSWVPAPFGLPQASGLPPFVFLFFVFNLFPLLAFHALLAPR